MPTAATLNEPTYKYNGLTADLVIFTRIRQDDLESWKDWHDEAPETRGPSPTKSGIHVLLIGRKNPPYPHEEGYYCTPGGFVDYGEDPKAAAPRELQEETSLPKNRLPKLRLVDVYGTPGRDPRRHIITLAFTCVLDQALARQARGADDAKFVEWVLMSDVLAGKVKFGFDHEQIVRDALAK